MTNTLVIVGLAAVVLVGGAGVGAFMMLSDSPDATASFQPTSTSLSGEHTDWTVSVTNNMNKRATIQVRLSSEEGESNTLRFADSGVIKIGEVASGQTEKATFRVFRNQTNDATVEVTADVYWVGNQSVLTSTTGTIQLSDADSQ